MTSKQKIHLKVSEDSDNELAAYLSFPGHPGTTTGVVKKQVRLRDLVGAYTGPDLFLDFDEHDALIGVEILE